MKPECEYCKAVLSTSKKKRRFCPPPKTCRQRWHHENTAPGLVTGGPRQLKSGKWQITVLYPTLPPVQNGDRVLVEKADISRPEPSTDNGAAPAIHAQLNSEPERATGNLPETASSANGTAQG